MVGPNDKLRKSFSLRSRLGATADAIALNSRWKAVERVLSTAHCCLVFNGEFSKSAEKLAMASSAWSMMRTFCFKSFHLQTSVTERSLSVNGEVERREGLVGMFSVSLSAGRRRGQQVDGRRAMPAPVSAELKIRRKGWREFNLVCRGWRGETGRETFLIGGDGEVVNA
jgi:hypothetical protein